MIGSLDAYLALTAPTAPRLDSAAADRPGGDRQPAQTSCGTNRPTAQRAGRRRPTRRRQRLQRGPNGDGETAAPAGEPVVSGRTS